MPSVTSGSSPASLIMAQEASDICMCASLTGRQIFCPNGVSTSTSAQSDCEKSMKAAAFAAACAQVPVVNPYRNRSFNTSDPLAISVPVSEAH